jgi:hypothetical protein
VGGVPWKEILAAAAAVTAVGAALAVANGMLDSKVAAVINAGAGLVVAALIAGLAWRAQRRSPAHATGADLSGEWRAALIDRVRQRWIGVRDAQGRLTGDGKLAADLPLGDVLDLRVERLTPGPALGPTGVLGAWQHCGHTMVLTGPAGTGKSVQLLLLTEHLLDRAERDEQAAVPVVVGLPSWRPGRETGPSFDTWLATRIHSDYRVPEPDALAWLASGRLVPVLDGLDEIFPDQQQALFDRLSQWLQGARPPAAWALGCRDDAYRRLDPHHRLTGRASSYWRVRPVTGEDRTRFLRAAQRRWGVAWEPVVAALDRGRAPHLAGPDGRGVLATPLGLAVAVETYRPLGPGDRPDPAVLLRAGGNWDRLWARYAAQRFAAGHIDPDRWPEESGTRFDAGDARRWLSTMATDETGLGRVVARDNLRRPDRPARWARVFDSVLDEDEARYDIPLRLVGTWAMYLPVFGAVAAWRGWTGWTGALLGLIPSLLGTALVLAGVGVLSTSALLAMHFPLYRDHRPQSRPERGWRRRIAEGPALAAMGFGSLLVLAAPGYVIVGADPERIGVRVLPWLQGVVSRLDEWTVTVAGYDVGVGRLRLGAPVAGALTGLALAVLLALMLVLAAGAALLAEVVLQFRWRDPAYRDPGVRNPLYRLLWWLDDWEPGDIMLGRVRRHVALRWWCYGTPVGRRPTGLLPPPRDWDRFLHWATHRGFLRAVGDDRLWLHETLRRWFERSRDVEAIAALLPRRATMSVSPGARPSTTSGPRSAGTSPPT